MYNKISQLLKEKPWLWAVVVLCIPLVPFTLPIVVPILIALAIKKAVDENRANDLSPIVSVPALVVAKRSNVSGGGETMTSTTYYATFELEDGERMEFNVRGAEYGLLTEGDHGTLTYQRKRYHGFTRGIHEPKASYG